MSTSRIYMDYQATTPVEQDVAEIIYTTLTEAWGNPSSNHHSGVKAKATIKTARDWIGKMVNSPSSDIVFTSGGTEANNMVIWSAVKHFTRSSPTPGAHLPHIITSALEHDSVTKMLDHLVQENLAEVTVVSASPHSARVEAEDLLQHIKCNTCLVTIMMANNETGVIQPVREIVQAVKTLNSRRDSTWPSVLTHTDAAQALGKIPVDVAHLGVDYLTIVGHKFYGPRIGALCVRDLKDEKTPVYPMLFGGGQEQNLRSGTENTSMIAGLGKAAELVYKNLDSYQEHMASLQEYFEQKLVTEFGPECIVINGKHSSSRRTPSVCNFSFIATGCYGYRILQECQTLQASVGAACHSDNCTSPSPILLASGVPYDFASNAIRISFGRKTSKQDIDLAIKDLEAAYKTVLDNVS